MPMWQKLFDWIWFDLRLGALIETVRNFAGDVDRRFSGQFEFLVIPVTEDAAQKYEQLTDEDAGEDVDLNALGMDEDDGDVLWHSSHFEAARSTFIERPDVDRLFVVKQPTFPWEISEPIGVYVRSADFPGLNASPVGGEVTSRG